MTTTTRIIIAVAFALMATLIFAAIASGDPETVTVVVDCEDCDELDGHIVTIGETTYVLTLPTPTPIPTPTATPETGFVPLTEENAAKALAAYRNAELDGRALTQDEVLNLGYAWNQYVIADFIHRCFVNGYEFLPLRKQVLEQWEDAEYIGDVSENPLFNNIKHFQPNGNPDFHRPHMKLVRSVYRIEADLYVVAEMGLNADTCDPISIYPASTYGSQYMFDYEYAIYDADEDRYVEMTWHNPKIEWTCCDLEDGGSWYLKRTEGYWERDRTREVREHDLDPLTNLEVETGNTRCRIRCDGGENLDDLRNLSSN